VSWSRCMIVLLVVTNRRMVASAAQLARTIFRPIRRPITGILPAATDEDDSERTVADAYAFVDCLGHMWAVTWSCQIMACSRISPQRRPVGIQGGSDAG
jgi:hypothetical protein